MNGIQGDPGIGRNVPRNRNRRLRFGNGNGAEIKYTRPDPAESLRLEKIELSYIRKLCIVMALSAGLGVILMGAMMYLFSFESTYASYQFSLGASNMGLVIPPIVLSALFFLTWLVGTRCSTSSVLDIAKRLLVIAKISFVVSGILTTLAVVSLVYDEEPDWYFGSLILSDIIVLSWGFFIGIGIWVLYKWNENQLARDLTMTFRSN